MTLRSDSFCEWSVKNHMEELAHEDAQKYMADWYERAVDEQKKERRNYKKQLKAQEKQAERISLINEDDLVSVRWDGLECIGA